MRLSVPMTRCMTPDEQMAQALKLIAVLLVTAIIGGGLYLYGTHLRREGARHDAQIQRLDCEADPLAVDCR